MYNFPSIVKTTDVLSIDQLITEIRECNLVEAQLPNGVLRMNDSWTLIIFDWDDNKCGTLQSAHDDEELKQWIENLLPKETEEEREERLRWEQENQLRAAGLEESIPELDDITDSEMYDEDAAFNHFYFG